MDGCRSTLCGLLCVFIWDRACHGASKDVELSSMDRMVIVMSSCMLGEGFATHD